MKTTNPLSRITISQNGNQILTCKVYKEPNYIYYLCPMKKY